LQHLQDTTLTTYVAHFGGVIGSASQRVCRVDSIRALEDRELPIHECISAKERETHLFCSFDQIVPILAEGICTATLAMKKDYDWLRSIVEARRIIQIEAARLSVHCELVDHTDIRFAIFQATILIILQQHW
jgi:hypothetical protein